MSASLLPPVGGRQRGAATLVIVMVLFLVMALLAAYANRTLMLEQRISSSFFRATVAQEMAEAGLEWSLAQLNGEATNASCNPLATGGTRFVDRYLSISPADRGIRLKGSPGAGGFVADCARTRAGWTCRCPAMGAWAAPAAAAGTDVSPSFGITIQPLHASQPSGAGTVEIRSTGCTDSVVAACTRAGLSSKTAQGASVHRALVALVSAVRSPPAAPLVVKGNVSVTGGGLGLHNTDPRSAGLLHDVGGTVSGFDDSRLNSVPGTSPSLARISGDATLSGGDVFRMFMGAKADRYKLHPSLRTMACNGDCAGALAAAYAAGRRLIWVEGPLSIQTSQAIGSSTDPVVIVTNGNASLSGAFQLTGMLVVRGDVSWRGGAAASSIVGMLVVEGNLAADGVMDIVYQPAVADQLRNRVGSFVRVPGGWSDTATD